MDRVEDILLRIVGDSGATVFIATTEGCLYEAVGFQRNLDVPSLCRIVATQPDIVAKLGDGELSKLLIRTNCGPHHLLCAIVPAYPKAAADDLVRRLVKALVSLTTLLDARYQEPDTAIDFLLERTGGDGSGGSGAPAIAGFAAYLPRTEEEPS